MPALAATLAHARYLSYVLRHKWWVLVAGLRIGAPLWRLLIHDWSKFSLAEWGPYVRTFYGGQVSTAVEQEFDRAWLHHQHRNPHHWQHWILRLDDGGERALPMPEPLVREMAADWMGAGRAIRGRWEVWEWYCRAAPKMLLHPETRRLVERLIRPKGER